MSANDDSWLCAGCGKPSPGRVRACDCPTSCLYDKDDLKAGATKVDVPSLSVAPSSYVADYRKSDGTFDYFVMLRCADREMSLHSHRIRGRAEYEAAEINHVLIGSLKPTFDDFDVDGEADGTKPS